MILKTTSLKHVIAKVIADNNIQEDTTRINDFIEWGAEAIERIGAFKELTTKVAGKGGTNPLLTVENYQAQLPSDLHSIIQVAYSVSGEGDFVPVRTATGSFDAERGMTVITDNTDPENPVYGQEDENTNTVDFNTDVVYTAVPGYIKLNVPEGYLLLAYRAIPTDEDGYPTLPDDAGFVDAVYWYITMKYLYPKWVLGEVRDMVYFEARRSWNYYSKQAYGNSMMPTPDDLITIKNIWNKILPEMLEENTFYSTIGERQYIRNQTNRHHASTWFASGPTIPAGV